MTKNLKISYVVSLSGTTLVLVMFSCSEPLPPLPNEPTRAESDTSARFDLHTASTLRGEVIWTGPLPTVPAFQAPVSPSVEAQGGPRLSWPNPHTPDVDPKTKAVRHAVVFLRGVDPSLSRPWDLPSVRVLQHDYQYHIQQGNSDSRMGFVRRGDSVEMVATDRAFYSLQARGAAFFGLVFPDPDQPASRRLMKRGIVELSSESGQFWMRAHLFVDDHPYYTCTDAQGRFTLAQVPPGKYELVCWMPNWHEASHARDQETWLIMRLFFQPPVEITQPITIEPHKTHQIKVLMPAKAFEEK